MIRERGHSVSTMNRRIRLKDLNSHLMCVLCAGYFVDATTIIECLHSFCRSCIVKHLESSKYCPICEVMVHKTKPLTNIRRDKTLQDIVYKLVPGLFSREMKNRRQFYKERPHYVKPDDVESGGEVSDERKLFIHDDSVIVSLRYHETNQTEMDSSRFLKCPIGVTIGHLEKLVRSKYGLEEWQCHVEIFLNCQLLYEDLTLLDISSLYKWRNKDVLEFTYKIYEKSETKPEKEASVREDAVVEKECKESTKQAEVVEKEVQLQITESGIMSVSAVESVVDLIGFDSNHRSTKSLPSTVEDSSLASIVSTNVSHDLNLQSVKPVIRIPTPVHIPPKTSSPSPLRLVPPSSSPSLHRESLSFPASASSSSKPLHSVEVPRTVAPPVLNTVDKVRVQNRLTDSGKDKNVPDPVRPQLGRPKRPSTESDNNECLSKKPSIQPLLLPEDKGKSTPPRPPEMPTQHHSYLKSSIPPASVPLSANISKQPSPRHPTDNKYPASPGFSREKPPVVKPLDKRPVKTTHKPISRATPQIWHPVITKEKLRPTLMKNSDEPRKPCKFFQTRNMPRYLGNPASGVKPMYSNGLPPAPPSAVSPTVIRVDPKTLRPIPKEEKKSPSNTLLTNPFIPRDNHFLLPDPKTQPYPYSNFPPGFHTNLPPSISHLFNPQHFRNLKAREEGVASAIAATSTAGTSTVTQTSAQIKKNCDIQPQGASKTHSSPPLSAGKDLNSLNEAAELSSSSGPKRENAIPTDVVNCPKPQSPAPKIADSKKYCENSVSDTQCNNTEAKSENKSLSSEKATVSNTEALAIDLLTNKTTLDVSKSAPTSQQAPATEPLVIHTNSSLSEKKVIVPTNSVAKAPENNISVETS